VFFTPINILPETVDDLVMVACIFHNILRDERANYSNNNYGTENDGNMKLPTNVMPFIATEGNSSHEAFCIRELLKNYFNSEAGSVRWPEKLVTRTS